MQLGKNRKHACFHVLHVNNSQMVVLTLFLQIPRLLSLKPSRGPVSGGTIVNITGSNLDAGSNVSIMLKDQKCTFQRYSVMVNKCPL